MQDSNGRGPKARRRKKAEGAKLMAQAKVSKDAALKTALAKVPNGTIKEAELEKEHGELIWSFDVATLDSNDITEVNVDAITGDVVQRRRTPCESGKGIKRQERR